MSESARCPAGWPGWQHVRHFIALWLLVSVEFFVVFGGADALTAHRIARLHLFLPVELQIPLVPWMVLVYTTIYLIFIPAPLILRTREEIDRFAIALAKVILIAGAGFILVPAQLGFPPLSVDLASLDPASVRPWRTALEMADAANLDYNLVPSLHVALFVTSAGVYARLAGMTGRVLLGLWSILVVASTVLTHQHHLIDAITGVALGLWGIRMARVAPLRG